MVDIAIVGAGPAGLSAAVNAAARNKSVLVIGRAKETSALWKAERVANHLGANGQSGAEIMEAYTAHAQALGIEIRTGRVLQIMPIGKMFALNTGKDIIEAKAVILATGVQKGKTLAGEEEYLGKGVSYCATCDGMLYRGKDVVVIGEIAEADEEASFLAEVCASVRYFPLYGAPGRLHEAIQVMEGKPEAVLGEGTVTGVRVNGEVIPCGGVFMSKAAAPPDSLVFGLQTEGGAVVINRLGETNVSGVFACGDCTGWPHQLSKAVGEGLAAAQQAARFLDADKA